MNADRIRAWLDGLPAAFTPATLWDVLLWLVLLVAIWVAVRLSRRWADRHIEEVNKRHRVRKNIGYAGALVALLAGAALLAGSSIQFAAVLGILGAGAAIALQDVAKNAIGWVYLSSRTGLAPGARIEVDGVVGDVIDIGVLKTTVLEVGNLVQGRQSSGRLASIPNARFLTQSVLFSPEFSPYAWHEISFLLTYESDWRHGVEVLEELGHQQHEELARGAEGGFRELERRFAFKHGPLTPIVYVRVEDSGVLLTLRYLTHIRRRRGSEDHLSRALLDAVARDERLEIAYRTWRIYRRGEGAPGAPGEGAPGARGEGREG